MNSRFTHHLLPVILLLIFLAQLVFASPTQSAAFDEGYTITYGYAYLHTGDPRLSRGQNPPLTNVFIALPLLLRNDVIFPSDHSTWVNGDIYGFSDQFLWKANVDRAAQLVLLVRLPEMALALLLACTVYAFARLLFGDTAALIALLVCVFDPNLLAHGHVAGTDLGVTLFLFSAVWLWTVALKRDSWRAALIAGLLTGAALSTKYSAVWLAPILLVITLVYPGLRGRWKSRLQMLLVLSIAAFVVIWGTFAFSIGPLASGGLVVPAPQYWESLGKVATRVESSTPAFMLDQISPTGFLQYYPFVFLVKTPVPTLVLLTIGIASLILRRKREDTAAWIPPLLFGAAAMLGGLNLGYRLILPVLPFALMIAGQGGNAVIIGIIKPQRHGGTEKNLQKTSWLRLSVVSFLCLWLVIDVLSIGPSHIAYFNQLINRDRDYEALVDSNLDWGQDLVALREWQQRNHVEGLNLAYYGTARPAAYGLHVNLLPSFTTNSYGPEVNGFNSNALSPGWYAISATSRQLGLLYAGWNLYAPFSDRVPIERVGRSLLMYHIAYPKTGINRAVVLGPFAGDLDRTTLGGQDDRQLIVKWADSTAAVLDMQGPARYLTRGGEPIAGFAPAVHNALITNGTQLGKDASGDLRLWEIDARSALSETLKALGSKPIFAPDGSALALPVAFDGGLSLIGYDVAAEPDQPIDLVTYWRVERPPKQPVAIFAHALDGGDQIVAQQDGLGVKLSSLEPGDIILQHFTIQQPAEAKAIEIGLYDPSTGERQLTDRKLDRVELKWK